MHELTQTEFATLVGLTRHAVFNLQAAGIPHRTDGKRKFFPMPDAFQWYMQRKVDAAVDAVRPTDFDESRAREMKSRAEKAELEVAVMRRELVRVDDAETKFATSLAQLRAALLGLPGRIAAELPLRPVEALEIIEPIVHAFMAQLSEGEEVDDPDDAA